MSNRGQSLKRPHNEPLIRPAHIKSNGWRKRASGSSAASSVSTSTIVAGLVIFAIAAAFVGVTIWQSGRVDDLENAPPIEGGNQTALNLLQMQIDDLEQQGSQRESEFDQFASDANMTIQDQQDQIDQLSNDLMMLQSQFQMFVAQPPPGTGGTPDDMQFVNSTTPFQVNAGDPNCCVTISSGRLLYTIFDYLNRGDTGGIGGQPNVTQVIFQNWYGVAFRMFDGIVLPAGNYEVDFDLTMTQIFPTSSTTNQYWVSWIRKSDFNTPNGIDFSLPGAPTAIAYRDLFRVTNRIASLQMTNPAGTTASYSSTGNFFISTENEVMIVMVQTGSGSGATRCTIESFEVRFNKLP